MKSGQTHQAVAVLWGVIFVSAISVVWRACITRTDVNTSTVASQGGGDEDSGLMCSEVCTPSPTASFIIRRMRVTAYCPCEKCCAPYADGVTASGKPVSANGGRFVAAPREYPFGTMMSVPGYAQGTLVPVLDRGGAIKGDRIDVFFPTHREALLWGVQYLDVQVQQ